MRACSKGIEIPTPKYDDAKNNQVMRIEKCISYYYDFQYYIISDGHIGIHKFMYLHTYSKGLSRFQRKYLLLFTYFDFDSSFFITSIHSKHVLLHMISIFGVQSNHLKDSLILTLLSDSFEVISSKKQNNLIL